MSTPKHTATYVFSHREVATALVKLADVHEGIWGLALSLQFLGTNAALGDGDELHPSAVTYVTGVGIARWDEPSPLTVDAAMVNPRRLTGVK